MTVFKKKVQLSFFKHQSADEARIKSEQGSFTVETSIVFSVVFLAVCMMLYMMILLFERAEIQTAADFSTILASLSWRQEDSISSSSVMSNSNNGQMTENNHLQTSFRHVDNENLYWRIFDINASGKSSAISSAAEQRFHQIQLPGFTALDADTTYKSGVLNKSILVDLYHETYLPNRSVMSLFSQKSTFNSSIYAASLIPDFSEFQRNLDYAVEIEKEIEADSPELRETVDAFSDIVKCIHKFIGGLF